MRRSAGALVASITRARQQDRDDAEAQPGRSSESCALVFAQFYAAKRDVVAARSPTALPEVDLTWELTQRVAALLGVLPTADELELVRNHAASDPKGGAAGMGRVERFFLCLDEIYAPEQRLRSVQVTQQFDERAERLSAHVSSLRDACSQLQASVSLRELLKLVLLPGAVGREHEQHR